MHKTFTILIFSCAFVLVACAKPQQDNNTNEPIIAANGMRLIALDTLVDGCQAYRQVGRPGQMVIQVIYYKHGENNFSPIREGATCD